MGPIECLVDQWHGVTAPAAENDGTDWDAFAFFHIGVESRIITHRRGKPAVGMSGFFF
jgi:hypothetical protein